MDQRVSASLPIAFRTPNWYEAKMLIETNSLQVLLIHIRKDRGVQRERMLHQCPAHTFSTTYWIDEQGFHALSVQQHPSQRPIMLIHSKPERHAWQERNNFSFNRNTVFLRQEMMRRINGITPYRKNTADIIRCRPPYFSCWKL